mmetsp:Transcript_9369/g.10542  ORF Transcript_9369/g.10542 Transcript_9369/m.10542 type:complete len:156 (-) Transcript_9369:208-675(-)
MLPLRESDFFLWLDFGASSFSSFILFVEDVPLFGDLLPLGDFERCPGDFEWLLLAGDFDLLDRGDLPLLECGDFEWLLRPGDFDLLDRGDLPLLECGDFEWLLLPGDLELLFERDFLAVDFFATLTFFFEDWAEVESPFTSSTIFSCDGFFEESL